MKFLIAGLGSIGRRHFRNLRALGEEDILFYRTHRASLPEDDLAGVPVETDLLRALDCKPDAVIVSNPTALHLDIAIPAARSGCHLLLEKPVSHSMDQVDELLTAVEQGGGKVLVGFQFRFHPGLLRVKQLLEEGAIGSPISASATWGEYLPGWHPWEDFHSAYAARRDLGGGVVLTLCHPLDYLHWLLGKASEIWAFTSREGLGLEVEDTAEIGIKFCNGAIGRIHLDYLRRPPQHRLQIVGTLGVLEWDNADGAVQLSIASRDGKNTSRQSFPLPSSFERNSMFLEEMRHFIRILQGKSEPVCSLEDGLYALKLSLAVLGSSRESKLQEVK